MKIIARHLFAVFEVAFDVALIVLSFQIAYLMEVFFSPIAFQAGASWFRFQLSLLYALIFVISAERLGQYESKSSLFNVREKAELLRTILTTTVLFTALNSFLQIFYSSWNIVLSSFWVLGILSLSRHFFFKYQHKKYLEGKHERKILIYGAGVTGQLLFKKLYFMEGGDYSLVGFLDDNLSPGTELSLQRSRSKGAAFTATVLGTLENLGKIAKQHNVYQVMIAMPSVAQERVLQIIDTCIREKVRYGFVPHLYNLRLEQVDTKNIGDIPLLKKRDYHLSFLYIFAKRLFDITASAILLGLLLPLFPLFALLIKMGSPGPIFFNQKRVGKDGKLFIMHKFRTMATETPVYMPSPSSNEPSKYINRTGSFLRDTNLDEIPQLWNVLKGEMSIVGPRPEMSFHVEKYDEVQRDRLKVQPGLTGLWQISPDRDKEIHDNIDYDLYYINNQNFFLDLVLVLETFLLTCESVWSKTKRFVLTRFVTVQNHAKITSAPPPHHLLETTTQKQALP